MGKWLRDFFRLRIQASEATITGARRPMGYQQILAATLATSTPLTVPAPPVNSGITAGYAVIQCDPAGSVRWRDDGVAPTATVGMVIPAGGELNYAGDLSMIRFIVATAAPILNVSFYGP